MAAEVLNLNSQWQFREFPRSARRMRDLDSLDWRAARVPSSIFDNLIDAGDIDAHEFRCNPRDYAWVSDKPWVYRRDFDASRELIDGDRIDLVFDGLDTIAGIWLNDKLIGKTDNMFIAHRFDVTGLVKPQGNRLLVKFDPAEAEGKRLMDRYTSFTEADFDNPHRVYVRKAQYQFGWDFAPSLPGCGIFRDVRLESVRSARICDVHIRTIALAEKSADLRIAVALDTTAQTELTCLAKVVGPGFETASYMTFEPGQCAHSAVIHIPNPHLWWPAGHGDQNLYSLHLELGDGHRQIDGRHKRFGIRTIQLDSSADDPAGHRPGPTRFRFIVNNRPIYIKGANWTPATITPGSLEEADYRRLITAARDANFNMLRVWGGGYYEDDAFYDLCDEMGIMLWQDFMFACAYYPDRQWFTDKVQIEATAAIERLRNHPSLALWCGNNEIDWLHAAGLLGASRKFYGKAIYHQLLPRLVAQLDPDAPYIPTTPLGQITAFESPRILNSDHTLSASRRRPGKPRPQPLTSHRWDVWSGRRPVDAYFCQGADVSPFVTEFGMQAMPDLQTIKQFCPKPQLRVASLGIDSHNYQIDGNSRLAQYASVLFQPTDRLERAVYCSQLTQARGVREHVEFLRTQSRNCGVMFWQFNEPAPAISWSAIDYASRPKALYYYAARFYAPVLVTVERQVGSPMAREAAIVVNDSCDTITAKLLCRVLDISGRELDRINFPVSLPPFSNSRPLKLPRGLARPQSPRRSLLHMVLVKDTDRIAENLFLYVPDKYLEPHEPTVSMQVERLSETDFALTISSLAVVKDLHISTKTHCRFSDNFVDVLPHVSRRIEAKFDHPQPRTPKFSLKSLNPITIKT